MASWLRSKASVSSENINWGESHPLIAAPMKTREIFNYSPRGEAERTAQNQAMKIIIITPSEGLINSAFLYRRGKFVKRESTLDRRWDGVIIVWWDEPHQPIEHGGAFN